MPDKVMPGPICEEQSIREAVCIHTKKIFDSCRDKDCIEDLRVYLTRSSQEVVDRAMSVKARCAQLLCAYIDVKPVSFNRGFYTVDVRYYYQVTADAFVGTARPLEVSGLAVFDKRVILFGSEGSAKIFSSDAVCVDAQGMPKTNNPTAVVEAVDPLVLSMKLMDVCDCRGSDFGCTEIPAAVAACFPEDLVVAGEARRMYVTLGQFSIIRLERDTQLLMPAYDYCMPDKDCTCGSGSGCDCQEDPCELFRKVQFPVGEFFPPNSIAPSGNSYQEIRTGCC